MRPGAAVLLVAALSGCVEPVRFGDDTEGPSPAATPQPTLAGLPPRTARSMGKIQCEPLMGVGHPCQGFLSWGTFLYDRRGHQLLSFGGSGGYAIVPGTDVTVFSFATLQWGSAYPPTPCSEMTRENLDFEKGAWISTGHPVSRQLYDLLVLDDRTGDLLVLTYGSPGGNCAWPSWYEDFNSVAGQIAHYHPDTRQWEFTESLKGAWSSNAAAEQDAVSGQIVVLSAYGLWTYDPASKAIAKRRTFTMSGLHYSSQLLYFPPNQKMYLFTRPGPVWEIALDRSNWGATTITEVGKVPASGAKGWSYDSRRRNFGGGVIGGVFYTFDPLARRWGSQAIQVAGGGTPPAPVDFFTLAYDPVDDVFVFTTNYEGGWRTWVYKPPS